MKRFVCWLLGIALLVAPMAAQAGAMDYGMLRFHGMFAALHNGTLVGLLEEQGESDTESYKLAREEDMDGDGYVYYKASFYTMRFAVEDSASADGQVSAIELIVPPDCENMILIMRVYATLCAMIYYDELTDAEFNDVSTWSVVTGVQGYNETLETDYFSFRASLGSDGNTHATFELKQ